MLFESRFVLVTECKVDTESLGPTPEGWRCHLFTGGRLYACKQSHVDIYIYSDRIQVTSFDPNKHEEQEAKAREFAKSVANLDPSTLEFKVEVGSDVNIKGLRSKQDDESALAAIRSAFSQYTLDRSLYSNRLLTKDHCIYINNKCGTLQLIVRNAKTRSRPAEWIALAKEVAVRLEALQI